MCIILECFWTCGNDLLRIFVVGAERELGRASNSGSVTRSEVQIDIPTDLRRANYDRCRSSFIRIESGGLDTCELRDIGSNISASLQVGGAIRSHRIPLYVYAILLSISIYELYYIHAL
uniref:Uncharacterized protein n=1 Tax=Ananas comosus var. bracteatus TaxID=296719 RepID=A0A6V7PEM8_ANACO|nr:unnamed protein product [Ananas comosus var. bracteatus]